MPEPTFADVDELVGPATPHFAYQLRARVRELVLDLPAEHPVRQYAEEKMDLLDRLGHASSKAADSRREPQTRAFPRVDDRLEPHADGGDLRLDPLRVLSLRGKTGSRDCSRRDREEAG